MHQHDRQSQIANNIDADNACYSEFEFDYLDQTTYEVTPDSIEQLFKTNRIPKIYVSLDSLQGECVHKSLPLILKGNAGSGKTLVGLKMLRQLANYSSPSNLNSLLYLTFTEGLRSFAEEQYSNSSDLRPDFFSIHNFCIKSLCLSQQDYVKYDQFLQWYNSCYDKKKFNPLDLWTEIRGIIKGYMLDEWKRDLSRGPMISFDEYVQVKESKFSPQDMEQIYSIAERYQKWLELEQKYDDNDLAIAVIKKVINKEIGLSYVAVIIDEIQDLTELQIYMISKLCPNWQVCMSGDPNQNINPTLFSFERIRNLLFLSIGSIDESLTVTLKRNYRSSSQIVNYLNDVSQKRQLLIGRQKTQDDNNEIAVREDLFIERLFNIHYSADNLRTILNLYKEKPHTAIIVSSSEKKMELIEFIKKWEKNRLNHFSCGI